MEFYAEAKVLGEVFGSRVALRLDKINGPEPDIVFILKKNTHRIKRGYINGPADIAVEIVSPDSVDRDYVKKRAQYERFGVTEYWILDEVEQTTTFLRLDKKGKYREVRLRDGVFRSSVLTGFWFKPDWLWQSPRPKKLEVLQLILGAAT
jgi:Uma2 family endonuclease